MTDSAFRIGGRPFTRDRLRQLVGYLGRSDECDHTTLRTSAWAAVEGYQPSLLLELLRYYDGMSCDCEIAHNAEALLFDAVGLKRLPPAAGVERDRAAAVSEWSRGMLRAGSPASQRAAFGLTRERPN